MSILGSGVANVTTVKPERTFWDKVIILHGLRQWYDCRRELRHSGQRVSRHYYDVHQLIQAASAEEWLTNHALALDCAQHARMFFGSADFRLYCAMPGTFTLTPTSEMRDALARDYVAMSGMVFGKMVELDMVLASV
jgi:Nucleotidyl transferase AbiEii toxin, Type IV TA system